MGVLGQIPRLGVRYDQHIAEINVMAANVLEVIQQILIRFLPVYTSWYNNLWLAVMAWRLVSVSKNRETSQENRVGCG